MRIPTCSCEVAHLTCDPQKGLKGMAHVCLGRSWSFLRVRSGLIRREVSSPGSQWQPVSRAGAKSGVYISAAMSIFPATASHLGTQKLCPCLLESRLSVSFFLQQGLPRMKPSAEAWATRTPNNWTQLLPLQF